MKELSIEEKAQRYDEAVNEIRNLRDMLLKEGVINKEGIICDNFNRIFPELKDEDERIKSATIEFVRQNKSFNYCLGISKEDVIDLIEKQAAQKPLNKIKIGKEYKCIASPRYTAFMTGKIYKPEDKFLCSLMNFCSDCFEPIEDNEKKPSEEYNITGVGSKHAEGKLGEMIKNLKPDKVEPKFKVGDKIYIKPEYRMPDDDTPIANTVFEIRAIDDKHYKFDGSYIFIEDQDKYELVEQASDWSEDDKNRINRLIAYFEDKESFTAEDDVVYANWLKSLKDRYTWKPSDEQMKALLSKLPVIKGSGDKVQGILESLYQDLKKLREE